MHAVYPLEARIFNDLQSDSVLLSEFFHLSHDAVCDVRNALGVQAFHHILYDVQFVFYREINEICIDKNVIRRA